MPAILALPAGLILGSFATVVAHRVPRGESIVAGRSRCPSCGAHDRAPTTTCRCSPGSCCAATAAAAGSRSRPATRSPSWPWPPCSRPPCLILGTDDPAAARPRPGVLRPAGDRHPHRPRAAGDPERGPAGRRRDRDRDRGRQRSGQPRRAGPWPRRAPAAALLCVALAYPRGMGMGDVKLAAVMGIYLGRAVVPAMRDRVRRRGPVRALADRPSRRRGAEAGGPLRAVPGPRRASSGSGTATRSSTGTWAPSSRADRARPGAVSPLKGSRRAAD